MIEAWEARRAGDRSDVDKRLEAANELAAVRGFRYLDAAQVADLPSGELLARIEAVPIHGGSPDKTEGDAILGVVPERAITVSKALETYWSLAADRVLGKSEDQLRRWKNPRKKAIRNFVEVVGNKALADITGDDMLDFRSWWMDRIENAGLTTNAANKDLIHLGDVLKTVNKMKRLGLVLPLTDLSFKKGRSWQAPAVFRQVD